MEGREEEEGEDGREGRLRVGRKGARKMEPHQGGNAFCTVNSLSLQGGA